jgi:precorrin-6B C5,15-methyltransferase / cobalt-precorrin-6B C5,C15-methyltransferase
MTLNILNASRVEDWVPPLVALVGMGMGPDDLSRNGLRWVERAEVLFGGKRHLGFFDDHPGSKLLLGKSLEQSLVELDSVSRARRTVVLASGDPLFYGIGRRLIAALGSYRVRVMPNVTTVQALAARIKIPWDDWMVFSLHGRGAGDPEGSWLGAVRGGSPVALFTDAAHSPAWVAEQLVQAGLTERELIVGEDLGLPTETVRRYLPDQALQCSHSPLNLCVILPREQSEKRGCPAPPGAPGLEPVFGLDESAFEHQAGLITKMEVRAVALAHLKLRDGLVLWDVGAGSGSVSIEASRMVELRLAVAMEKDGDRYRQLVENVRRLGRGPIETLSGNAVELLADLPQPDRVFIGGSGGDLGDIMQQVATRLAPGGIVVQTAVTLDTFEEMRSFWQKRRWAVDVVQVQVNRSVSIGRTLRLEALNPVFIVSAARPAGAG